MLWLGLARVALEHFDRLVQLIVHAVFLRFRFVLIIRSGPSVVVRVHTVVDRIIVKDDQTAIVAQLEAWISRDNIDVIIATGGTSRIGS